MLQSKWLHPSGVFRTSWDSFVLILVAYCAFELPLVFCVPSSIPGTVKAVSFAVDALFWLDFLFNFFTGIQDRWGQVIFDGPTLAISYLKGWCLVDFLASFPMEVVLGPPGRLFRILRFGRLIRKLEQLAASTGNILLYV